MQYVILAIILLPVGFANFIVATNNSELLESDYSDVFLLESIHVGKYKYSHTINPVLKDF